MEQTVLSTGKQKEPDWFRIGRDAVRVMDRLNGMKELDFYLRHPEPFIRLHAIRRVSALLLPDAVPALAKRLEDPLENEQNRDEAGWAIRRICKAREIPWFSTTPWTSRYDGTECAADRYGVRVVDLSTDTSAQARPKQPAGNGVDDEVLLRIQMEESEISLSFSVIPWLARNARFLLLEAGRAMLSATGTLLRGFWRLLRLVATGMGRLFRRLSQRTRRTEDSPSVSVGKTAPSPALSPALPLTGARAPMVLIGAEEAGFPQSSTAEDILRQETRLPPARPAATIPASAPVAGSRQPSSSSGLDPLNALRYGSARSPSRSRAHRHGKGGKSMFRLLFYPIRLVRHHWVFTLVVLVAFYALLGFTHPGRRFVYRLNPGAQVANDRLIAMARTQASLFLGIASPSVSEPAGASLPSAQSEGDTVARLAGASTTPDLPAVQPTAGVTAPKGLNLRETPASTGRKIVWMKPGDTVVLLGRTQLDEDGALWQTVSYQGQTGWAMDKWLSPAQEGASHAGS